MSLINRSDERRVLKKVESDYIEEIDSEGVRRIKVVTKTTKWFADGESRHNPTISTSYEYL
jgi:hypothetical protein